MAPQNEELACTFAFPEYVAMARAMLSWAAWREGRFAEAEIAGHEALEQWRTGAVRYPFDVGRPLAAHSRPPRRRALRGSCGGGPRAGHPRRDAPTGRARNDSGVRHRRMGQPPRPKSPGNGWARHCGWQSYSTSPEAAPVASGPPGTFR